MSYLDQYVQYIKNTDCVPLKVEYFDEDWESIGPSVRMQLIKAGLTIEDSDGIRLVENPM